MMNLSLPFSLEYDEGLDSYNFKIVEILSVMLCLFPGIETVFFIGRCECRRERQRIEDFSCPG
jgi:hypothetical protein